MSHILAPEWDVTVVDLPGQHPDSEARLALIRTLFDVALTDHAAEQQS